MPTDKDMKTSEKGIAFVKKHEGFRTIAYKDVAGHYTVGYGHLIRPSEMWILTKGIDNKQATELLQKDLAVAEECVEKHCRVHLEQCQFDALVSFVYNLGCVALERSTLLFLLNQGKYTDAADQFKRWNKAGGKVFAGLTKRREQERLLFIEGKYNG